MEDKLKYIAEKLGTEEILCQLAEEAAELSQAALKLRRCISGKNPTPKTCQECCNNLIEETSDFELCLDLFLRTCSTEEILMFMSEKDKTRIKKTNRWYERLKEKE